MTFEMSALQMLSDLRELTLSHCAVCDLAGPWPPQLRHLDISAESLCITVRSEQWGEPPRCTSGK